MIDRRVNYPLNFVKKVKLIVAIFKRLCNFTLLNRSEMTTELNKLTELKNDVKFNSLPFIDVLIRLDNLKTSFKGEILSEIEELKSHIHRGTDRLKICARLNYIILTMIIE